jgi:hypothetical protein
MNARAFPANHCCDVLEIDDEEQRAAFCFKPVEPTRPCAARSELVQLVPRKELSAKNYP